MCVQTGVLQCPKKVLVFFKRAMYQRAGIAVVASETVIDKRYTFSLATNSEHNVLRFNVEMNQMAGVDVLDCVELYEVS
jgi:hypothetical protein